MRQHPIIRTVPNLIAAYDCSAETAQLFIDLREEGYSTEQALLMAGLSDPPEHHSESPDYDPWQSPRRNS